MSFGTNPTSHWTGISSLNLSLLVCIKALCEGLWFNGSWSINESIWLFIRLINLKARGPDLVHFPHRVPPATSQAHRRLSFFNECSVWFRYHSKQLVVLLIVFSYNFRRLSLKVLLATYFKASLHAIMIPPSSLLSSYSFISIVSDTLQGNSTG